MVTPGKDTAADESTGTMEKRLKSVMLKVMKKIDFILEKLFFSSDSMKANISESFFLMRLSGSQLVQGFLIPDLISK